MSVLFIIFEIVLGLSVAGYHLKTSQIKTKLVRNLTFIMVICTFLIPTIWLIAFFDPFNSMTYCLFTIYININVYSIFKLIIYCILILRLHDLYHGTILAYNTKKLIIWVCILVTWTLFNVIFQSITSTTLLDESRVPNCQTYALNEYLMSIALLDIVSGIMNCYLFVKPIYKFRNGMLSDSELRNVAGKQMILTVVTILTSIIAMLCVASFHFPEIFAGLDIITSTVCILLMYSWNKRIFDRICCCCYCCIQYKIVTDETIMAEQIQSKTDTGGTVQIVIHDFDNDNIINENIPSLKKVLSKQLIEDNENCKPVKPTVEFAYFAKSEPVQSNIIRKKHTHQKSAFDFYMH